MAVRVAQLLSRGVQLVWVVDAEAREVCVYRRGRDPYIATVAQELTGGPIAPPTMISVWFRPHHWAPGRREQAQPLQVHFDLKQALALPEAVMTDNTIVFGAPVRPGDRLETWQVLRSVSEPKTTKLGTGRFWVIDVEYQNQHGEWVGTETYTGFGYRRDAR